MYLWSKSLTRKYTPRSGFHLARVYALVNTSPSPQQKRMFHFISVCSSLPLRLLRLYGRYGANKSLHWIFTPLRFVKTSEFRRWAKGEMHE